MAEKVTRSDLFREDREAKLEELQNTDYSAENRNKFVAEWKALDSLPEGEELPFKFQRFCQEYIVCYNEETAAHKAGYDVWNAYTAGRRLIAHPRIQAEIERLQKQVTVRLNITSERILEEIAKIAYSNILDILDADGNFKGIGEMDRGTASTISSVKFQTKKTKDKDGNEILRPYVSELKTWNKQTALKLLAQYKGLLDQNDNKILPDFKELMKLLPPEVQESIKIGLAKQIEHK